MVLKNIMSETRVNSKGSIFKNKKLGPAFVRKPVPTHTLAGTGDVGTTCREVASEGRAH